MPAVKTCNEQHHEFGEEVRNSDFLMETQTQLKDMSRELAKVRKQNQAYREHQNSIPHLKLRIRNLEDAMGRQLIPAQAYSEFNPDPIDINNAEALLHRLESYHHLLVEADSREQALRHEIITLRGNVGQQELKCKRIIGGCCNIPIEQVDDFVDPLLEAIESDGNEMDLGQAAAFVSRTLQQEQEM
jgi:hypothetical protein